MVPGTRLITASVDARVLDLDPRYVDVAVRRYKEVFGHEARLRGSGLTLDDLSAGKKREDLGAHHNDASNKRVGAAGGLARGRRRIVAGGV